MGSDLFISIFISLMYLKTKKDAEFKSADLPDCPKVIGGQYIRKMLGRRKCGIKAGRGASELSGKVWCGVFCQR